MAVIDSASPGDRYWLWQCGKGNLIDESGRTWFPNLDRAVRPQWGRGGDNASSPCRIWQSTIDACSDATKDHGLRVRAFV